SHADISPIFVASPITRRINLWWLCLTISQPLSRPQTLQAPPPAIWFSLHVAYPSDYGGSMAFARHDNVKGTKKRSGRCFPATAAAAFGQCKLHAIRNGIVPEAVQALQCTIHLHEFFLVDAAHLLDRAD